MRWPDFSLGPGVVEMVSAHCVFTAWFSGYHNHSCMLNGRDGMRSLQHLAELFVLTDALGLSLIPTLKDI